MCAYSAGHQHRPPPVPCSTCEEANFCSAECKVAALNDAGSHNSFVCKVLSACNRGGLSEDHRTALHYLVRAVSLCLYDPARYSMLLSLSHLNTQVITTEMRELHGRLIHALHVNCVPSSPTADEVAHLISRDEINAYGIMTHSGQDGERNLRGSAFYAQAALINHECMPNVARFDDFDAVEPADSAPRANTFVTFRTLHDLPAGEEYTQSYFPLCLTLEERQQRCQELYGFTCTCPRCRREATWEQNDEQGMADAEQGGDEASAAYVELFVMKYVCPNEDCFGTMAPFSGQPDIYQCNMCGKTRTEAEFLAELEDGE